MGYHLAIQKKGIQGATSYCADMAKSKNHTTHNQSWKGHRNGIKKPQLQRGKFLKGVDPKFLSIMCFAKRSMKGLKEMQADVKAISSWAEDSKAFVEPKVAKPKMLKVPNHRLSRLAFMTHPQLEK